jgi:hypothetical protein
VIGKNSRNVGYEEQYSLKDRETKIQRVREVEGETERDRSREGSRRRKRKKEREREEGRKEGRNREIKSRERNMRHSPPQPQRIQLSALSSRQLWYIASCGATSCCTGF